MVRIDRVSNPHIVQQYPAKVMAVELKLKSINTPRFTSTVAYGDVSKPIRVGLSFRFRACGTPHAGIQTGGVQLLRGHMRQWIWETHGHPLSTFVFF